MGVNGKNKGSSFERDIVKEFKRIFNDEGFMRTPHSGATFGKTNRSRMVGIDEGFSHQMTGDLVVPSGFSFSIECKAYKDLDFHNIIKGSSKQLDEWIEQAKFDADECDKAFLLVIKINNKGKYICCKDQPLVGNQTLLDLDNVLKYKNDYVFFSFEAFEEVAMSMKCIKEWENINKSVTGENNESDV